MYVCMYVFVCECVYVQYAYVCMYVCMYIVRVYVCMYVFTVCKSRRGHRVRGFNTQEITKSKFIRTETHMPEA